MVEMPARKHKHDARDECNIYRHGDPQILKIVTPTQFRYNTWNEYKLK